MSLKIRIIPCLDVKDGRHAPPAVAKPRGRAKQKNNAELKEGVLA